MDQAFKKKGKTNDAVMEAGDLQEWAAATVTQEQANAAEQGCRSGDSRV